MDTRQFWDNGLSEANKYDNYNSNDGFSRVGADQLNFAAQSEDEAEYPTSAYLKKGKVSRQDPMSHRIIEKRRRDRMNNCLADLSRLIPPEYLKKGRGRVEKTEIIEMSIRHLKFLQDRANAADRHLSEDHFRAGYQDAVSEVLRFLVEVHGYEPGDGLCVQLAAHMQRHCEALAKGEPVSREKPLSHPGSSSETASSTSSSHGYSMKPSVIAHVPPPTAAPYDDHPHEQAYTMECDRVPMPQSTLMTEGEAPLDEEPLPLDGRRRREPTLRAVRKPEHAEDYLHSYKFKNSIERRFSRSQDTEAAEDAHGAHGAHGAHKQYAHKRRRVPKPSSACVSTEGSTDTSPQDTSSDTTPRHHHYEKPQPPTQYVPVFALNTLGKYYVPLSIEYACLARHVGHHDLLDARAVHLAAPLHPVTIHVNFQPCLNYHVKREPNDREWRPTN